MSLLSTAELSHMRTAAAEALPGTAVVKGRTMVSDGGGGYTETYAAGGTVDCRIAPVTTGREGEREMGDRISVDAEYVVTLPYDVAITTDSRLTIDGVTYRVEAVRNRSWNLTTRVEVQKEG